MAHKLPGGLYALLDDSVHPEIPMALKARGVIAAHVGVIQLRLEQTGDRQALALIKEVVALAAPQGVKVIVNDRVDLALASGAAGVHLGDQDLPVDVARRLLGPEALIGATTRSGEEIERAQALGADHVGLGPIFVTRTKVVAHPPLGVDRFAAIVARSPLPVVGIAGITLATVGQVAGAGAWGAAVASDLFGPEGLVSRARALQRAFSEAR